MSAGYDEMLTVRIL